MTSTSTNLTLLDRARARDNDAWRELVDLYSPLVIRWCAKLSIGPEKTADCIQEVFASVARSLDTYHPPGNSGAFRGWLWTITRNKVRDMARRHRVQFPATGGSTAWNALNALPAPTFEVDAEPSDAIDHTALVSRALAQIEGSFAEQTWQAFWRSVVDGLSTETVAQQLGLSKASVRQARSRVLRRLREQMLDG